MKDLGVLSVEETSINLFKIDEIETIFDVYRVPALLSRKKKEFAEAPNTDG
jgi:hypothetical protein